MNKSYFKTGCFISFLIIGLATFVFFKHQNFEKGLTAIEPVVAEIADWSVSNFNSETEAKTKLAFIQNAEKHSIDFYKSLIQVHKSISILLFVIAFFQIMFLYQLYRDSRK
tara:strand:- start:1587 stop:1919 length:333 start_codon:yes stop_codon:yes gene_type:complete